VCVLQETVPHAKDERGEEQVLPQRVQVGAVRARQPQDIEEGGGGAGADKRKEVRDARGSSTRLDGVKGTHAIVIKGTRDERRELKKREKFIVDVIFPAGELHLIGGGSGAGKTTWLLQWLKDWSEGKPVFGYKSHPCPYVYVTFDRGLLSTHRTMERLGMEDWDFPSYPIEDIVTKGEYTIDRIMARFPEAELYVIEGFQGLLPDTTRGTSQNKAEMTWVIELRRKVLSKGKTLIGITHNPKMKAGESYESARSNFLGSNSLIGCTSTLVSFQSPAHTQPPPGQGATRPVETDEREVIIRGRDFPNIHQLWSRDSRGRFVPIEHEEEAINMEVWLDRRGGQEVIRTKDFITQGAKYGMADATVERWIKDQVDAGTLRRIRTGTYNKGRIQ
jgi:AAA domain